MVAREPDSDTIEDSVQLALSYLIRGVVEYVRKTTEGIDVLPVVIVPMTMRDVETALEMDQALTQHFAGCPTAPFGGTVQIVRQREHVTLTLSWDPAHKEDA